MMYSSIHAIPSTCVFWSDQKCAVEIVILMEYLMNCDADCKSYETAPSTCNLP
jgi:hypothetical protein